MCTKKQNALKQLYKPYLNCSLCPFLVEKRVNVAFGQGDVNARLMLIGEAPGEKEDLQGKPFVGRSGKVIETLLNNLSIKRSDIFITNIVKCRPPNNRTPSQLELSTCKKTLLENEIKIIQPKIICTLGSSAANALLGKKIAISKERGKLFNYMNSILIPTFHPAYTLRSQKKLPYLAQDLKKAYLLSLKK